MRRGPFTRVLPALVLAAATAAAFLPRALAAFDPAYNPHAHFRANGMCPKCHLGPANAQRAARITGASSAYCLSCHSGAMGRSHPIGVRPRDRGTTRVPPDLLLDEGGRVMCLTCHDAHGPFVATTKAFATEEADNPERAPGTPLYYRTRFIRRSDPARGFAVLCSGCHENL